MNNFWRIPIGDEEDVNFIVESSSLLADSKLFARLKPKHGILLADWNDINKLGKVYALGIVLSVNITELSAKVKWKHSDVVLKPNHSGCQYWRNKPFFKFAKEVSIRYMLDDLFAEHFPELDNIEFGGIKGNLDKSKQNINKVIPGYIYLIESQYGYKIGKTVNIKSRTNLFEVKLPFPIKLLNYAWFDDYSKAERDFHGQFAHKRLEGEWFDLNEQDINIIKNDGKKVQVKGL